MSGNGKISIYTELNTNQWIKIIGITNMSALKRYDIKSVWPDSVIVYHICG